MCRQWPANKLTSGYNNGATLGRNQVLTVVLSAID